MYASSARSIYSPAFWRKAPRCGTVAVVKHRAPAPIVIATIVILSVAAAWALAAPMLLERAESALGLALEGGASSLLKGLDASVSYESASPRLLGSITLDGLEFRSGGVSMARASRVELRYDVSDALSGGFSVSAIRVEGLSVDSTYEEAVALVARLATRFRSDDGETGPVTLPAGLTIELRRADLRLVFAGGAVAEASIRAADVVIGEGGLLSASAAGTLAGTDPLRRFGAGTAELPFSCTAALDLGAASATISAVVAGDSDIGRLKRARFDAELDADGFSVSLRPQDGLRRLTATWDAASRRLAVDAAFSSWAPSSLFVPRGALADASPWMASPISGNLSLRTDLSPEGTSASINVTGLAPLDISGGRPRLTIDASGTWASFTVREASLRNEAMDIAFSGELTPATLGASGLLTAAYALRPGLRAEAAFQLSGSGSSWFAYAPTISAADAVLRDATVSVELDGSAAAFYADVALPYVATEEAGGSGLADVGSVEASSAPIASRLVIEGTAFMGDASLERAPYVEAAVRLGAVPFRAFPGFLEALVGTSGALALAPLNVQGDFSVFSDLTGLSYNSSGLLLVYDGPINGFGVMSFSGGLGRLAINSFDATIAGKSVSGNASVDYGNSAVSDFSAEFRVEDVPYAISGSMLQGALTVTGDYGLRITARRDAGELIGSLGVTDMPVPVFGSVSFFSASADGRYASNQSWDVVIGDLSLSQPPGSIKPLPSISMSGAFDESGGRFGRLSYKDGISSLTGFADVTWAMGDGFRVSGNANMSGPEGESYVCSGHYGPGGAIDTVITIGRAPLGRLSIPVLRGVIDAKADISGYVDDPVAAFSFTVNGGQRSDNLPFLSGLGTYGGGEVTLSDTRIRMGRQSLSGLSFRYGFADAAAELSADIELSIRTNHISGRLVAAGVATGETPSEEGSSPFDDYLVEGTLDQARWTEGDLGAIPFSVERVARSTSLSIGPGDEVKGRLGVDGELSLVLDASLPISFSAAGALAGGNVSVDVEGASVDMPFLFTLLKLPVIRAESGTGRGSLRVRGKAVDPTIEGTIDFENLYLSVPQFVPVPIGPLDEPLYFTGRTMETMQSGLKCGDATLMASMESSLRGGIPDEMLVTVKTEGDGAVPVDMRLLGLDIEGTAKPDLSIDINDNLPGIRGSVEMRSGDIVLTTGVARQSMDPDASNNFTGALDLSFGKNVRVYFPNKRLPVIYGQTDPSSRLSVAFDAARGDYSLKGTTTLRGGSVFYIQRNFYLKHATIEFDEDADQFDPVINAEAETRSKSGSGPVLITLRAINRRLSDLSFTLESVPSMTEETILQLLGHNLLGGTEEGDIDIGRAIVENSDLIPQLNVMSVLERNLQAVLGLDLFVVRSQLFQRWLYDLSGLSGSTGATTLSDYLEDSEIVAGKYIGDKLFFQVILSLVDDPLASTRSLSLDSDISLEWKAPHFTLNWSIQPENLDSLFIEDQSFSFLWRIPLK